MSRVVTCDLRTGRRITDIPVTKYSWEILRNGAGQVRCSIPLYDPDVASLNLRNAATPGKALLAIVEVGDVIPNAGQLARPRYNWDEKTLEFTAPGIRAFLNRRSVLPPAAFDADPESFVIPDPADATKTIPNPALGTTLAGLDLGSIGFSIVRQMMAWPGGNLPIVVPANRAGTHTRTDWKATDLKKVGQALDDLSGVDGGPDFAFLPRLQADRLGVEWQMLAGTEEQPELRSETIHRFNLSVAEPSTRRLEVDFDVSRMGSLGWSSGGRSADTAIIARAYDPHLVDAGYPLQELFDASHPNASDRGELTGYAAALVGHGRTASEYWSFDAKKDLVLRLGVGVGDRCALTTRGDPYIPDSPPGGHLREIAAMSGDEGDWVKITTAEA